MRVASGNGPTQREDRTPIAQTNCIEARAGAHGAAACACARRGAAVQPRRLAGAVESVESVESVFGAGRPEGERSQSAGATEVASARVAELTTYHNLGYAVIFDGPRAAQPASQHDYGQGSQGQPRAGLAFGSSMHSGRAGPPPREWRTPLASQARTADGSSTCAKRQASPRVQDPVWNFMHTPPPAWLSRGSLQSFERWPCLPQL